MKLTLTLVFSIRVFLGILYFGDIQTRSVIDALLEVCKGASLNNLVMLIQSVVSDIIWVFLGILNTMVICIRHRASITQLLVVQF